MSVISETLRTARAQESRRRIQYDIDFIDSHDYVSYDSPNSQSNGSKAVYFSDLFFLLNTIDHEMTDVQQRSMFAGKDSDEFQQLLNDLVRHTDGMANTVFRANAKLLVFNAIKAGFYRLG